MHSDKEKINWKLRHCRLYDGNKKNVYESILQNGLSFIEPINGYKENKTQDEINEILSIFYAGERVWIELDENNRYSRNTHSIAEFEGDLGKEFENEDGTPRDLKVLLYTGFLQFVDGVYNRFSTPYETNLFKRYYKEYYQPILTPNEKREKERRPSLIEKCLYYKGETDNPWEYCYSPVLVWRKEIWNIEKEWVDAMVCSYNCPQSSKALIKDLALEEFFGSKGVAISLLNLIFTKKGVNVEAKFGPIEAIKLCEKYQTWAPLGRDHRMYFAYYLGEDELPYGYENDEEYKRMGWTQERLQLESFRPMCDYDSRKFQKEHRGKDGIWGWYADPKFPKLQKDILFFTICNWGTWCPYCDEDKLAEEYLNYHYTGDGRPKHTEKFYHDVAYNKIKDDPYCCNVRKCGMYENKRVYKPIYTKEYNKNPVPLGLPLVILVDDDGNAEYIRTNLSFKILDAIRGKKSHKLQ